MPVEKFNIPEVRKWSWGTTFEKAVKQLPGVTKALYEPGSRSLEVAYDDRLVERKAIEDRIAETLARFLNKGFVK
jgi:hypothetical protein